MDAFARQVSKARRLPWMSINWEGWHRREVAKGLAPERLGNFGAQLAGLVMSDEEVIECFQRALRLAGTPQLVIATGDIQLRINQWIRLESLESGGAQERGEPAAPSAGRAGPRRDLVPPRDEIERTIIEVGRSLLGIAEIGVYDNFFERGGSSLLAVQFISRLREAFKQQIPLSALFEQPTVAGLASVIRANQPGQEDLSEIYRLLAEIEQLDDQEIAQRLATEMQKAAAETTNS